jgi:hypothetical protein
MEITTLVEHFAMGSIYKIQTYKKGRNTAIEPNRRQALVTGNGEQDTLNSTYKKPEL